MSNVSESTVPGIDRFAASAQYLQVHEPNFIAIYALLKDAEFLIMPSTNVLRQRPVPARRRGAVLE